MNKFTLKKLALISACSLVLLGCSGGGGGSSEPQKQKPAKPVSEEQQQKESPKEVKPAVLSEANYIQIAKQVKDTYFDSIIATYDIRKLLHDQKAAAPKQFSLSCDMGKVLFDIAKTSDQRRVSITTEGMPGSLKMHNLAANMMMNLPIVTDFDGIDTCKGYQNNDIAGNVELLTPLTASNPQQFKAKYSPLASHYLILTGTEEGNINADNITNSKYDFKLHGLALTGSAKFKVTGKDFETFDINKGNVLELATAGSIKFYSSESLKFKNQRIYNGKIVIEAQNGTITLIIKDGKAEVKATIDNKKYSSKIDDSWFLITTLNDLASDLKDTNNELNTALKDYDDIENKFFAVINTTIGSLLNTYTLRDFSLAQIEGATNADETVMLSCQKAGQGSLLIAGLADNGAAKNYALIYPALGCEDSDGETETRSVTIQITDVQKNQYKAGYEKLTANRGMRPFEVEGYENLSWEGNVTKTNYNFSAKEKDEPSLFMSGSAELEIDRSSNFLNSLLIKETYIDHTFMLSSTKLSFDDKGFPTAGTITFKGKNFDCSYTIADNNIKYTCKIDGNSQSDTFEDIEHLFKPALVNNLKNKTIINTRMKGFMPIGM